MTVNHPERRRGKDKEQKALLSAARVLYEGTPGMTLAKVAAQVGLNLTLINTTAVSDSWRKNYIKGEVTPEAQALADKYTEAAANLGPVITADESAAITKKLTIEDAIAKRAEILARHRTEWAAPRGMSAEAVRMRDTDPIKAFERAKMAKITSETIKIVQDGERKAWGIDVGELPDGAVVVIERETKQVN